MIEETKIRESLSFSKCLDQRGVLTEKSWFGKQRAAGVDLLLENRDECTRSYVEGASLSVPLDFCLFNRCSFLCTYLPYSLAFIPRLGRFSLVFTSLRGPTDNGKTSKRLERLKHWGPRGIIPFSICPSHLDHWFPILFLILLLLPFFLPRTKPMTPLLARYSQAFR